MCRWAVLLTRQGGGRTNESFDDDFFAWLSQQILVIEDYPYAGIDFLRDPEIPVPPGEERGEMGKFSSLFFCFFLYIIFFYTRVVDRYLSSVCRCGTSTTSGLCEEQASSSARGCTCCRRGTSSNRRASSRVG